MIDLHLHTTASDGRCTPHQLVGRAAAAGLTVIAVTDHDTTDAVAEVSSLAAGQGMTAVPGIEITAVEDGADVHVLGYFVDVDAPQFQSFLAQQRDQRVVRVERIARRLRDAGLRLDIAPLLEEARRHPSRAVGRPQVARAMIAAGLAGTVQEAFDKWLGHGRPGFVSKDGVSPESVIETIHRARGLAALAHPGRTRIDARIPGLRDAGLDALEAYHSDHTPEETQRYGALARTLGLLMTGGSDFHGDPDHGVAPGGATLPRPEWERLLASRDRHA